MKDLELALGHDILILFAEDNLLDVIAVLKTYESRQIAQLSAKKQRYAHDNKTNQV